VRLFATAWRVPSVLPPVQQHTADNDQQGVCEMGVVGFGRRKGKHEAGPGRRNATDLGFRSGPAGGKETERRRAKTGRNETR